MLHSDLELVLKAATDPFVATMVAEAEAKLAAQQEKNPKKGGGDKGGRFASVSAHFLGQLNQLTTTLQETNAHFVRCINPNTMKKPDAFTGGHVLHQLRCSGMMEALRLMHAGFPTRCPYEDLYDRYKAWADEYFYIPHRERARGVGGIFMDDRNTGDWEADFALTQDIGRAFLPAWVPLVESRRTLRFGTAEKDAQLVHRGLYAEYNLVYDRGTKFGLETGHDPNAVLMSLPPLAKWV